MTEPEAQDLSGFDLFRENFGKVLSDRSDWYQKQRTVVDPYGYQRYLASRAIFAFEEKLSQLREDDPVDVRIRLLHSTRDIDLTTLHIGLNGEHPSAITRVFQGSYTLADLQSANVIALIGQMASLNEYLKERQTEIKDRDISEWLLPLFESSAIASRHLGQQLNATEAVWRFLDFDFKKFIQWLDIYTMEEAFDTWPPREPRHGSKGFKVRYRIGDFSGTKYPYDEVTIYGRSVEKAAENAIRHFIEEEGGAQWVSIETARINVADDQVDEEKAIWVNPYDLAPSWRMEWRPTAEELDKMIREMIEKNKDRQQE